MLFSGLATFAHAQESGGTYPSSNFGGFFYTLDIAFEKVWLNVLGVFSSADSQIKYINEKIKERREEQELLPALGYDITTKEFARAKELEGELRSKIIDLESKKENPSLAEIEELREEWREELGEKNLSYLAALKEGARNRLLEVLKSGDGITLASAKEEFEKAKKKYDEASTIMTNFRTADELEAERIEEIFFDMERADLVIKRAERLKAEAEKAKWNVKNLLKLLDEAKKAREKSDVEKVNKLTNDLQKTSRETGKDIERQKIEAETKKDLAVEKKPVEEPKQPVPAPRPKPKPILEPIPSENVSTEPLVLNYYQLLTGEVQKYFRADYSATGGLPPYHFQLDSGTGFPPIGIILDPSGLLSGYPKSVGGARFSVCVVDTAGESACGVTIMTIDPKKEQWVPPAPAPQPTSPPPATAVNTSFVITSASCKFLQSLRGTSYSEYEILASGTASGPPGARLVLPSLSGYTELSWTNSWGDRISKTVDRLESDPETTTWTARIVYSCPNSGCAKTINGYVRVGENKTTDSGVVNCQ